MSQRTQVMCKNHPTHHAGYYLSDQPWIKLCSQCALNIAVCGKKIEKELSEVCMERKLMLNNLVQDIRTTSEKVQEYSQELGEATEKVEEVVEAEIGAELRKFNGFIGELEKLRDQLWTTYQQKVLKPINHCFEKQSKIILNGIQFKKILEYIDNHFNHLIEDQQEEKGFDDRIEEWRQLVYETKELMPEQTTIKPPLELQPLKYEFYHKFTSTQQHIKNFHFPILSQHRRNASKENSHSLATETPLEDSGIQLTKANHSRVTHLKLRSASKKSHNKKQIQSVIHSRKKGTMKDITNLVTRISGWNLS